MKGNRIIIYPIFKTAVCLMLKASQKSAGCYSSTLMPLVWNDMFNNLVGASIYFACVPLLSQHRLDLQQLVS